MDDSIDFVGSRGFKRSLEVLKEVISPSTSDDTWSIWDRDLRGRTFGRDLACRPFGGCFTRSAERSASTTASRSLTDVGRSSARRKMITLGLSSTPSARISPKSRSKMRMTLESDRARDHCSVRRPLHREGSDVSFVPELSQEIDRGSGQARIGKEPHRSRAKRVELVLCQCGGVRESLPNVLLVDVWEIGNDLGRCHAVGDQVGNGTWSFTVLIAGRG